MHEDLARFYEDRGRNGDLFKLLVRMGEVERALNVLASDSSLLSTHSIPEDHVQKLLDYTWAGRLICASEQPARATARFSNQGNCFLTRKQLKRCEEWDVGCQLIHNWQGTEPSRQLGDMLSISIKQFLCLCVSSITCNFLYILTSQGNFHACANRAVTKLG
jgi:hypothetical protein